MSVVVFPGFLATTGDTEPLVRAGVADVRIVSLPTLVSGASRDEAVARARALIGPDDIVVGYSLGARVALAALSDGASRGRALLLLSATRGIDDARARAARARTEEAWAETLRVLPQSFVEGWREQPIFGALRETAAGRAQYARRLALAGDPVSGRPWGRGWAEVLSVFGQGVFVVGLDAVSNCRLPTVVVAGGEDGAYVDHAAHIAGCIAGARREVVAGAGHALLLEAPGPVSQIIHELSQRTTPTIPLPLVDERSATRGARP